MRRRISQSALRVKKNRMQRYYRYFFGDLGVCMLIITITVLMTSTLIYLYCCLLSASYFQIREIIVRGCREVTEQEVLTLASLHPRQNLFSIRMDKLARQIKKNPWIKEIYLGRELPDRLVMEVHERVPLALVEQKQNLFIVDHDGVIFKSLGHDDGLDLPVITGYDNKGVKQPGLLKKSLELLIYLSDTKQAPISYRNLSEVHLNDIFGLSLITDSGLCLVLGFDDFGNKLRALPAVLEGLEKKNIDMALLNIDLRDPAKITVQSKAKTTSPKTPAEGKEYRT